MIIVKLVGGLGNQMFQYAAARRLAHVRNTELKLDVSAFQDYKLRKYQLSVFNVLEKFATQQEIDKLAIASPHVFRQIRNKVLFYPRYAAATYIKRYNSKFFSRLFTLPDNVYLAGYWQSEKYFVDIKEIIKKEFVFKPPLLGLNKDTMEEINNCESVGVHVRRTDYLKSPVHHICDAGYYLYSIQEISKKIKNPRFFIFSDDLEWCESHLKTQYSMVFVDHNKSENSFEDMRLMSQCKHHVICNSSFSWWAAWLNPRLDKIIFAPRKWFNGSMQSFLLESSKDIIPDDWIKI